ncbi:MAG: hypothetical protein ACD_15C00133G0007 [uncultured bacterium]|nr:MAG: hypothetical protein ACD_15C00133G0007 [uncultured bacterium]HBD05044.1 ATP synthase F0 subunit A [Candidatus Uhrbacteria bacterium]HCU70415.1 ATP synthase F0 subunit A [Candidatus Moranbacteria bacterium]
MEISLVPETIYHIGNLPLTNSFIMTLVTSVIIIGISFFIRRNTKLVPRGFQNIFEAVIEYFMSLIDSVTQDKNQTRKFFPIVMTIFFFVIISNWMGLLPGAGTVGVYEEVHGKTILAPFIRSASADLNTTLALSLVAVFFVHFMGISAIGIVRYGKKFLVNPFHKPYFIGTFVGILELISEIAKIVSFSFRLFGNVFAGEVLLIVMLNLVPYIMPLPFLFLEVFVGFVQALVFAMLTLVFLKMATVAHDH